MSENENDNGKPAAGPTVVLDEHRGLQDRRDAYVRRNRTEVRADQAALREGQVELEKHLFAGPAATWVEAGEKASYLLHRFATTGEAQDPRYKQLIEETLRDLERLAGSVTPPKS